MRLVTFEDDAGRRIGAMMGDERILDLTALVDVPGDMLDFIAAGPEALERAHGATFNVDRAMLIPLDEVRLLAPIPRPRKNVFALGLNYANHVAEGHRFSTSAWKMPEYPVFFSKGTGGVIGPADPIPFDGRVSVEWDWEAELGVVIGGGGRDISKADALDRIFGYTCINDISLRDLQRRHGGQFFKGKSVDGTCPIGPWIATRDEIEDPGALRIVCRVNGVVKQDSNTRHMIFDVPTTIASLSEGMTLEPGDIIATGTPDGVGGARTPPEWLAPGDVVEIEVEGIGVLRNAVIDRWA